MHVACLEGHVGVALALAENGLGSVVCGHMMLHLFLGCISKGLNIEVKMRLLRLRGLLATACGSPRGNLCCSAAPSVQLEALIQEHPDIANALVRACNLDLQ